MRAYPGAVKYSDLTSEQIDGLMLHIPSLEARDTISIVNALSAMLGGAESDSQEYLEGLIDLAYQDDPDMRTKAKLMMQQGEARRRAGMNSQFETESTSDAGTDQI